MFFELGESEVEATNTSTDEFYSTPVFGQPLRERERFRLRMLMLTKFTD